MENKFSKQISLCLKLYQKLARIRVFEESLISNYPSQKIRTPVHLSLGQEAISAGVCESLGSDDIVISNHRNHGHYLAKGGDITKAALEMYGKDGGCAGGKGGSMHLLDTDAGFYGCSAIVSGSLPLLMGVAFAKKYTNKKDIAVAFIGDGATEEGSFYECLNYSSLRELPLLIVVENNKIATLSPIEARQAETNITKRISGFGLKCSKIDGRDAVEVYNTASKAIKRVRERGKPEVLEISVDRWMGHVGPAADDYPSLGRSQKDYQRWVKKCPLKIIEKKYKSAEYKSEISRIYKEEEVLIKNAFEAAMQAAPPLKRTAYTNVLKEKDDAVVPASR